MDAPWRHPLDIQIADLVAGTLDDPTEAIQSHIQRCLLCRIKHRRLTGIAPAAVGWPWTLHIGARVEAHPADSNDAQPGDLWVTDTPENIVVLVRTVVHGDAIVVPVVPDIETADDECWILSGNGSPLGEPIVVHTRLVVNIPLAGLARRLVPVRCVDLLTAGSDTRTQHGPPITGPDDSRLDIRQWLADCLTRLSWR